MAHFQPNSLKDNEDDDVPLIYMPNAYCTGGALMGCDASEPLSHPTPYTPPPTLASGAGIPRFCFTRTSEPLAPCTTTPERLTLVGEHALLQTPPHLALALFTPPPPVSSTPSPPVDGTSAASELPAIALTEMLAPAEAAAVITGAGQSAEDVAALAQATVGEAAPGEVEQETVEEEEAVPEAAAEDTTVGVAVGVKREAVEEEIGFTAAAAAAAAEHDLESSGASASTSVAMHSMASGSSPPHAGVRMTTGCADGEEHATPAKRPCCGVRALVWDGDTEERHAQMGAASDESHAMQLGLEAAREEDIEVQQEEAGEAAAEGAGMEVDGAAEAAGAEAAGGAAGEPIVPAWVAAALEHEAAAKLRVEAEPEFVTLHYRGKKRPNVPRYCPFPGCQVTRRSQADLDNISRKIDERPQRGERSVCNREDPNDARNWPGHQLSNEALKLHCEHANVSGRSLLYFHAIEFSSASRRIRRPVRAHADVAGACAKRQRAGKESA